MAQAQHETFREELAIKYPAFGYALWEPGSRARYHTVEVGDVGFIREGYFHRLFNVLHPASGDDSSDPSRGVPGRDELLRIKMDNHIGRSIEGYKEFLSRSIRVESRGRQCDASRPEDDVQVTFSCTGKRGALLSLPFPAQREDTAALRDFGKCIVRNIDAWFAYAEDLGLGIDRMEDIILVTGCHRARSWVIATFSESQAGAQVSFGAEVLGNSGVGLEWRDARGGDLKLGPRGRNLPEDQCLFVRGFRVVRFLNFWPRLRGQATPSPDVDDRGPQPGADRRLSAISGEAGEKYQDPLHVLLQYIAEQAPECEMALVHDDDLTFIDGAMLETLEPDELIGYLRNVAPEIQQIQYDGLSGDTRTSGAEVTKAKVATLSQNAFKAAMKNRSISNSNLDIHPLRDNSDSAQTLDTVPAPSPPKRCKYQHQSTDEVQRTAWAIPTIDLNQEQALSTHIRRGVPFQGDVSVQHERPIATVTTDSGPLEALLIEGYIARCFGPRQAGKYFACLLRRDLERDLIAFTPNPPGKESASFVVPRIPRHTTSPSLNQSSSVLDRTVVAKGPVVPQALWEPDTVGKEGLPAGEAGVQMPIFFECTDGRLGIPLEDATAGQYDSLLDAQAFAPLGSVPSTLIRILWPGYVEFQREIQIRDETFERHSITYSMFAHLIRQSVDAFLKNCQLDPAYPNQGLRIGQGGIQPGDIMIIGAVHISPGSWMPILQLKRYISDIQALISLSSLPAAA